MKIHTCCKKVLLFLAMIAVCGFFIECGSSSNHLSPLEQEEGYYWYEAIFLQKDDVEAAFRTASDHFPNYEYVPDDFHVTTQFKPDPKHESLYGTAVTVHITGYTTGAVQAPEGDLISENEGFLVEVSSSGQLDFSNAMPIDLTIEGVFGLGDTTGMVILE